MDWKSAQEKEDGQYLIPKRWLEIHYYEALNILFRTENSLRVFVYTILKNKSFDKWADTAIKVSEDNQSSIAALEYGARLPGAEGDGIHPVSLSSSGTTFQGQQYYHTG